MMGGGGSGGRSLHTTGEGHGVVVEGYHPKREGNVTGSWDQNILMDRGKFWNRPKDFYHRSYDIAKTRWQLWTQYR